MGPEPYTMGEMTYKRRLLPHTGAEPFRVFTAGALCGLLAGLVL